MDEKIVSARPTLTAEKVLEWALEAIEKIDSQALFDLFREQLGNAGVSGQVWAAFDLLNRVDIAYLRQLSVEMIEKSEACKASWSKSKFEATFVTPREGRQLGWLDYVSAQVSAQVAEYEKEDVEAEAVGRENAVHLSAYQRQALARAIENAEKLLSVLDPKMGPIFVQLEKLTELYRMLNARSEACKQAWPTDRFIAVFVTPKPGHEKGWLAFVEGQVEFALTRRNPESDRLDRAVVNAEKILTVLRPEAPYWCRKCQAPLESAKFSFCESCHREWLDAQGGQLVEDAQIDPGLHRKFKKPGSAARRTHKPKPAKKYAENSAGFEAASKDGAKKREQREKRSNRRGEGE